MCVFFISQCLRFIGPPNQFKYTSWIAVVIPNDRPKLVRYRFVIEIFGGVFVMSLGFLLIFFLYRGIVMTLSQT